MLFIVNTVFEKGTKESTIKENILKMIPEIYDKADQIELIKLFMEWYNNSPQYILGGFSPMKFRKIDK